MEIGCMCADVTCAELGCKRQRGWVEEKYPFRFYPNYDPNNTTREVVPVDEQRVRQIVREELKKILGAL